MKRLFLVIGLLFVLRVHADSFEPPVDSQVITGELSNGLAYYVRPNSYPKQTAALRLVVKVGSLYEKDDEKGLAHFVEHMVFRGSRHFADEESIKYLESIGAWYGADTNASTSFESTRYELNIPLDKEGVLEKSLLILSDFAAYATIPEEALEAERGVILSEMHLRTGSASWKLFEKQFNFWTQGSGYENHFPIGLESIVQTVSAEKLREFYRRWYRPDRMAVIAVGDFDAEKVKQLIEKLFGEIPCPEEVIEEPTFEIDFKPHSAALIHHDPELTSTDVSLISFREKEEEEDLSFESVKSSMISYFTVALLGMRLDKLSDMHPAPVLNADAVEFPFSLLYSSIAIQASLFENRWKEGIQALHEETRRVSQFGFTALEWKKFKAQMVRSMRYSLENSDKREHEEYVLDCIDHFLNDDPLFDPEWSQRFSLDVIDSITVEDLNKSVKPWDDAKHWTIIFSTPSHEIIEQLSPEFLLASLECDKTVELEPPVVYDIPEMILGGERQEGYVSEIVRDEELGVTTLTLSNGVKMVLKPSQIEKGSLEIFGKAKNGYASLSEDAFFSARFSIPYFYHSGIGELANERFQDYLEAQGIHFHLGIGYNYRSLILSSIDRNHERLFEFLHAFFTVPRFDKSVWEGIVDRIQETVKERLNDPETVFEEFAWQFNTQNHFLFQPIKLEKADPSESQKMFEKLFSDPADFTFIVVGDFVPEEIEKLAARYLASVPPRKADPLPSFDLPVLFPRVAVQTEFRLGSLPHAKTVISIPFDYEKAWDHFGTNYYISAAEVIFEQRLTEVLRKKMGNTYYVKASVFSPFSPSYDNSMLQVSFSCPRTEIQKMVQAVFSEMRKMQEMPPTEEEVATVRELFLADKKRLEQTNSFWFSLLNVSEDYDVPLKDLLMFQERIESITPAVVQEAAAFLFESPYYTVLSHVPEDGQD
jgi:zinc protease